MSKNKSIKPWDLPHYKRVKQGQDAKRPLLMMAQGKRLYRITRKKSKKHTDNTIWGASHGIRKGQIYPFMSSASASWSIVVSKETTEISWLKPKKATLMRMQGHIVEELTDVDKYDEGTYTRHSVTNL